MKKVDIVIFSPLYILGLLNNEMKNVLSEVKLEFTTVVPTPTKLQTRWQMCLKTPLVKFWYIYNIKKTETACPIEPPLPPLFKCHTKTQIIVRNRTAAVGRAGVFTNNSVRRLCNKLTVYKVAWFLAMQHPA